MKKILLVISLICVSTAFLFAEQDVYYVDKYYQQEKNFKLINIAPSISYFKKSMGYGVQISYENNLFTVNGCVLNGNLRKREYEIVFPYKYHIFLKHLDINSDNFDEDNNFIGIHFSTILDTGADDLVYGETSYITGIKIKFGAGIEKDNPYLLSIAYNYLQKIKNNIFGFSKIEVNKYSFGTEYTAAAGVSFYF